MTEHDEKLREAVALFRYGLIADLVHLPRGARGMGGVVGQIKPTRIRRIIRSRLRLGWSHYFVFADRRRPADATAVG